MSRQSYIEFMYIFNHHFMKDMIITWPNGLKVKCNAYHGMAESADDDIEKEGGYYTLVKNVDILNNGKDDSIYIENDCILICKTNIPDKIELLDKTVVWQLG